MMNQPLVSVIIPVYGEKDEVLRRSIEHTACVCDPRMEVIVVADGEDQITGQMREELTSTAFAEKYSPVRVYSIPHGGVCAARNYGMTQAVGKWIFFLDADDRLDANALLKCAEGINGDPDIVMTEYSMKYEETEKPHTFRKKSCTFRGEDTMEYLRALLKPQTGAGFAWGKLIRKEFLDTHQLCFREGLVLGEDAEFMVRAALKAEEILYLPVKCLDYCYQPGSAVRAYHKEMAQQYRDALDWIRKDLQESGRFETCRKEYCGCAAYHLMLTAVNCSFHQDNEAGHREQIRDFKRLAGCRLYRISVREASLSDVSLSRKITLILLKLHMYEAVRLVAKVRQRQLERA